MIEPLQAETLFIRREVMRIAKTIIGEISEDNCYIITQDNLIVGMLQIERKIEPARQLAPIKWTIRNFLIYDKYRRQGIGTAVFEEILCSLHGVVVWDMPADDKVTYRFVSKLITKLNLDILPSENNDGHRKKIQIANQSRAFLERDALIGKRQDVLLSVKEAAALMSISKSLLYRLIADGEIPTAEEYNKSYIWKSQLENWIDSRVRTEGE